MFRHNLTAHHRTLYKTTLEQISKYIKKYW